MKYNPESSYGGGSYSSEPPSHILVGRNEPPLSAEEELVDRSYRKRYDAALPDNRGIKYKNAHRRDLEILKNSPDRKPHTERSMLFDKVVFTNKEWWGSKVEIHRASKYDDEANGTDLILEFLDENDQRIGLLSIDTTVPDNNEGTLGKKLNTIVNKIVKGTLGTLDYAPDPSLDEDNYIQATYVPQALITVNPDGLKRLSLDLARAVHLKEKGDHTGSRKEILNHPIQLIFLEEVITQLTRQCYLISNRLTLIDDKKRLMLENISNILGILEKIKDEKENPHRADGEKGITYDPSWKDAMALYLTTPDLLKKICPLLYP